MVTSTLFRLRPGGTPNAPDGGWPALHRTANDRGPSRRPRPVRAALGDRCRPGRDALRRHARRPLAQPLRRSRPVRPHRPPPEGDPHAPTIASRHPSPPWPSALSALAGPAHAAQPSAARCRRSWTSPSTAPTPPAPASIPGPGPVEEPVLVWSRIDRRRDQLQPDPRRRDAPGRWQDQQVLRDRRPDRRRALAVRGRRRVQPLRVGSRRDGRRSPAPTASSMPSTWRPARSSGTTPASARARTSSTAWCTRRARTSTPTASTSPPVTSKWSWAAPANVVVPHGRRRDRLRVGRRRSAVRDLDRGRRRAVARPDRSPRTQAWPRSTATLSTSRARSATASSPDG